MLFATETFAMGINMPAKTVVFTAMRKSDGSDFRWVGPGEYIQMSGRAGRRGLDDRGIVIQMMDEKIDEAAAKEIMSGQANPLASTFHLGYNMVLNLIRTEDADPEFMIRNSLYMFQRESEVPALQEQLEELTRKASEIDLGDSEPQLAECIARGCLSAGWHRVAIFEEVAVSPTSNECTSTTSHAVPPGVAVSSPATLTRFVGQATQ